MEIGNVIKLNGGEFKVVYLQDDEVRIQRTTEPMIVTAGDIDLQNKGIKLMGWRNFAPYQIIKTKSKSK